MKTFSHILVPVDFETSSRRALEIASDLASQLGARLTVLHAWDLPLYMYSGTPHLPPELWSTVEEAARETLQGTLATVRERVPGAEARLVRGPAAAAILAEAERSKADLLVLGTHGRKGLSHVLLGSVAEKVVRGASVPVLTVHGEEAS